MKIILIIVTPMFEVSEVSEDSSKCKNSKPIKTNSIAFSTSSKSSQNESSLKICDMHCRTNKSNHQRK